MAAYAYSRRFLCTLVLCPVNVLLFQVDPNNPPWPAYRGYHEYSFAHATMGVRLPTILGKAIDDVTRTLNEQSSEEKIVDLVHCIERMDALMQDLSGNQKLRPIIDDGEADVALWNKEIAKYFQGLSELAFICPPETKSLSREGFHECALALRRSLQVSPPS
jgi:hypothetical protein